MSREAFVKWGLAIALALLGATLGQSVYAKKKAGKATPEGKSAAASIESKSGSTVAGKASFTEAGKEVTLKVEVEKAPPGKHAVHIHDKGDCSSPDGKSAGDHWNPMTDQHGEWSAEHHHLGDIGNMDVGPDGKGTITLTTDKWTIGTGEKNDVAGHAIIVHGGVDDFKTQPTGNAGPRIGCGVISVAK
jgi:Cu-Zn family superoxide dismutase